jgi:hypothetical protein
VPERTTPIDGNQTIAHGNMQPSARNLDLERPPANLSVFQCGHDANEPTSVKPFHKYGHKPHESSSTSDDDDDEDDDDDDHLGLTGRACLFCACQCLLQ